jgi:hypothetical protein
MLDKARKFAGQIPGHVAAGSADAAWTVPADPNNDVRAFLVEPHIQDGDAVVFLLSARIPRMSWEQVENVLCDRGE